MHRKRVTTKTAKCGTGPALPGKGMFPSCISPCPPRELQQAQRTRKLGHKRTAAGAGAAKSTAAARHAPAHLNLVLQSCALMGLKRFRRIAAPPDGRCWLNQCIRVANGEPCCKGEGGGAGGYGGGEGEGETEGVEEADEGIHVPPIQAHPQAQWEVKVCPQATGFTRRWW